ncbi:ankyrin repeat domain-containing protein [Pseudomonas schmalbachii]|uniref:Ankyrin repeat domain-containing protein n=1 Tax=Pseudomonas schmalbachii TaxID=2816993 RepID=A0ABS3TKA4_9PSED|nr:ankyrin repeat domain-containing protein [Pseudomonas schmalbachii]MBO3273848.1 ankyrin repeat domain-containing protein [Pseudomonas schmalbachii]
MSKFYRLLILMLTLSIMNSCAASREVGGMTSRDAFDDPRVVQMVEAASNGDFKEVDAQIKAGANVNAVGKEGITPLIWQVYLRNVRATEKLLQEGANPNYRDEKHHASALYLAVDAGRVDLLDILLRYKGDPNLLGPQGDSLLHKAVMSFCRDCVELLVERGADVNIARADGDTPANVAVGMAEFDLIVYFLEHGLHDNLQDLAFDLQSRVVPPDSEAQRLKDKVIEMLKARGVQYPDPRYSPPKPPPGWQ